MAYVVPTIDEFRELFTEFDERTDEEVTAALNAAATQVDTTWREADYKIAIMLLTAHFLAAAETAASGREISSESIGPLSVSYFKSQAGWIETTGYGTRYQNLLEANHPPILVI